MRISELKQPYRRMAEYLAERNNKTNDLGNAFDWHIISYPFWKYVNICKYPPITSEIKRRFPADFDFSEEEEVSGQIYFYPTGDHITRVNPNEVYTQLAKEGKFNELPSTCEFSEPVKLLVSNLYSSEKKEALIIGKLKDRFFEANFQNWQMAYTIQEPTEHKVGDVVEVETENFGVFFGMIHTWNERGLVLTFGKQSGTLRMITDVKSIKKIK